MLRTLLTCSILTASVAAGQGGEPWTFVSMPDFWNSDIGSVVSASGWDGGLDSTTATYEEAKDYIMDSVAAENPRFVAIAGDLVMGHWDRDVDNRQIFGPVGNLSQKQAAVAEASALYYDVWLRQFTDRGLNVVPALGDHELGDNNWNPGSDRARLVADYKDAFIEHLLKDDTGTHRFPIRPVGTAYDDSAYAFQEGNVLFVTMDVFRIDDPNVRLDERTGAVLTTIDSDQLAWLDALLADARQPGSGAIREVDFIIVQGHVPVLRPVRVRSSSRIFLRDYDNTTDEANADIGEDTDFWQVLETHDVDLYLCGEVHDVTLSEHGGVTQLVHGAIIGNNTPINYLVGTVYDNRIELEVKEISPDRAWNDDLSNYGQNPLWQTGNNRPPSYYEIPPDEQAQGYTAEGTATLDRSTGTSVLMSTTGKLIPFNELPVEPQLLVQLPLDGTGENIGTLGSSNTGSLEGDATFGPGVIGQGVVVSGAGRVHIGELPPFGSNERTVSLWMRTTETSGLRSAGTFGQNSAGSKFDMDIDTNNAGVIELGVGSGRTAGQGPSLNDGTWHLLTYVLPNGQTNLSDVRMYVDGLFIYSDANATRTINTASGTFYLGQGANSDYFQPFIGSLDDVAIWNDALNDAEVAGLHAIATEPLLSMGAASFAQLRRVAAGEKPVHVEGAYRWEPASGLAASTGLVPTADGFTMLLDLEKSTGVRAVDISGCPADLSDLGDTPGAQLNANDLVVFRQLLALNDAAADVSSRGDRPGFEVNAYDLAEFQRLIAGGCP